MIRTVARIGQRLMSSSVCRCQLGIDSDALFETSGKKSTGITAEIGRLSSGTKLSSLRCGLRARMASLSRSM